MNAPFAKQPLDLLMPGSLLFREPTIQGTEGTVATPRPSKLAQRIKDAFAALMAMPSRRAVLDELSSLSDRELADNGLSRADLKRVFEPAFVQSRG